MTKVLIIESSATEALKARLVLEQQGCHVSVATDGPSGLAKASAEQPDVILMETVLPGMSGYEVWERLMSDAQMAAIPVVMLTSASGPASLACHQSLSADRFCAKPYQPADLVQRVLKAAQRPDPAQHANLDSQAEVERLKRELETARQAKRDFLSTMSHELRTPLHEIMGMTELALGTQLDEEQTEYLNRAKTASETLLALITDIIQFSEIQSGQLGLDNKRFDLWDVLGKTMSMMLTPTEEKGLDLNWHMQPGIPREFVGDAQRVRQIVSNLLDNAIKFTEQGEIELKVSEKQRGDSQVELEFVVRDTGVGIAPDKLASVFDAFEQADSSTTRVAGGMGMGLAIAKQLVTLMGGQITAESKPGQGSTFRFTIHLEMAPAKPEEKLASSSSISQLHILLAEDSPTNQLLARANLKKAGHTVEVADNGLKAIQALAKGGFDLILMDVAMPELDGLDATRRIREQEAGTGGHIPIIAMTAFAMNEYREKCIEAGMDGYVTKPVSADELRRAIEEYLARLRPNGNGHGHQVEQTTDQPPVDLAVAIETAGDDPELLDAVVGISMEECPRLMQELHAAIVAEDAKGVEHSAHTLKGTVANIGSGPARELAQQLETMGSHGDIGDARHVYAELEPAIAALIAFFEQPDWQRWIPVTEGQTNG